MNKVTLERKIKASIKLCDAEITKRKKSVSGEATIEQIEEFIIPDLNNLLDVLASENVPRNRNDRYLLSFAMAFKEWCWSMKDSTELYKMLAEIHHGYQNFEF